MFFAAFWGPLTARLAPCAVATLFYLSPQYHHHPRSFTFLRDCIAYRLVPASLITENTSNHRQSPSNRVVGIQWALINCYGLDLERFLICLFSLDGFESLEFEMITFLGTAVSNFHRLFSIDSA